MTLPPAAALLSWYATHRRHLPWRAEPGQPADPYHVWLSEIMLQQTVAATVVPYYARFLAAYPSIMQLAAAPADEVMGLWAGLGYYARARNLHECARQVAGRGGFPADIAQLRALPGIGPYTAAAIGAIAFKIPVLAVDGNVERVAARVFAIAAPVPAARPAIARAAAGLMIDPDAGRAPGDFTQALFDLGATICAPRSPACGRCPWLDDCAGARLGIAAGLPARTPKPARPHRTGTVYALLDDAGDVLLVRRPEKGLLGGMMALPEAPPVAAAWRDAGSIEHVFTHFSLTLSVKLARRKQLPAGCLRAPGATAALPSVMRKALDAALRASKTTS